MRTFNRVRKECERESFDVRVYRLLNRPGKGKYQDDRSGYRYGYPISRKDFEAHLRGDCTIAMSAVDNGFANFLAFDIDQHFEVRLPVVRNVLRRRGLERASFAVNGSSVGRGKVVVTLAKRVPQSVARRLAFRIVAEMQNEKVFGTVLKGSVSVYPTGGDGSFVRLFGRNRQRARHKGLTEAPLDLDGNLSDLCYIEPAVIDYDREGVNRPGLSAWAKQFVCSPYTGNTAELWRAQVRLAAEVVTLYGADAERRLSNWFQTLADISPQLRVSTRRQLLRPDAVARSVAWVRAHHEARRSTSAWQPRKDPTIVSGLVIVGEKQKRTPRPAVRAYNALANWVLTVGLDAHCFGITYERAANLMGYADKADARAAILKAQDANLLFRLDQGTVGYGGMATLYTLRGEGETLQDAYDAGVRSEQFQRRLAERKTLGLDAPEWILQDGKATEKTPSVDLQAA